jgi:hypothetical protein
MKRLTILAIFLKPLVLSSSVSNVKDSESPLCSYMEPCFTPGHPSPKTYTDFTYLPLALPTSPHTRNKVLGTNFGRYWYARQYLPL